MNIGIPQEKLTLALSKESEKCDLPECFTIVPAVALTKEKVAIPEPPRSSQRIEGNLNQAVAQEKQWINNSIAMLMETEQMEGKDIIAWSTYHASQEIPSDVTQPALMQLLPLFGEKAATAAMVKHGMSIIKQATQYLNPGQVSVIALDAPLFALAKLVQWNWPQTHGEDLFVVMFGGLHIEMALWKTFGDYLESSGWTNALVQAGITSSGAADSFLKASHLTRTRHAHQVSALALSKLQHEAFLQSEGPHDESTKEAWREEAITKSPTFQFWDTILKIELLGLIFVRAHRQRKFSLYVESLKGIAPWFFALDHHNYARWIPVHIRDMECLPSSVYEQFEECGHWVVQKTTNRFSAMPIDQCHEQNNETVKGSGGAVGLTENPAAFRRWMTAGPEQARLLKEFECEFMKEASAKQLHHEEGFSTQKAFKEQTQSLVDAINEMGNPFLHDSADLVVLDSRDILDNTVVSTVRRVEKHGLEQYNMYYETVIKDRNASIHNAIRKNSFPLFSRPAPKIKSKQAEQISMLKHDVELFSRLYIVMQHRDCDMATFFQHENHPYPPSLSNRGKLRLGKKSDLLGVLPIETDKDPPVVFDVKVLDGAAIVHFLSTTGISTFDEYAGNVFMPYIKKQLEASTRVDVVWDTYITCSLKESTREKRGKGMRREVTGRNKLPRNWIDFLQNSENKQQLFSFLSHKLASMECVEGKQVIVTTGTSVAPASINRMQPCNHEEADTRMVVHLVDALDNGATTCFVRTVDTDVVTIIAGKFHDLLQKHPAADLWLGFGVGKTFRHIHINAMCNVLGREKSVALPIFHAFTGCDTTSAFFSKGKKSAWEAWKSFPEVTGAFLYVASHPHIPITTHCEHFKLLERFCVILYDKTSSLQSVDEARKELFCQKNRTMELIPPTQNALLQHCNRVIYQAGIWSNSNITNPDLPSPEEYGWKLSQETKWCPVWITLPVASKACTELVKCNCKSSNGCGGRCSCKKAQWKCTQLCTCNCEK